MAAMKPRTGDGPLVLEITADEVKELGEALANAKI